MPRENPVDKGPFDYSEADPATELGLSFTDRLLVIIGIPVLGMALGFFLPRVAEWAAALPWAPLQGPLTLIASLNRMWVDIVCIAVGLVIGLVLAFVAITESLKVTLTDAQIQLDKDDKIRTITRSEVDAVFVDGKKLVVLDGESRQLVREICESSTDKIARAFQAHGYPWVEQDPYAELYRRWVPDTPDMSPAANAVLRAREAALRNKADEDAVELREEVQKLGFVVRDEGTKQYWRPLVRS